MTICLLILYKVIIVCVFTHTHIPGVSGVLRPHPSIPRSIVNNLAQRIEHLLKHGLGLERLTEITSV